MLKELIARIPNEVSYQTVKVQKSQIVFPQSDAGKYIFILLEGSATCQMDSEDGSFTPLYMYQEYDMFGEIEIFYRDCQSAYIEAVTDCRLLKISRDNLFIWMKEDFEFNRTLIAQLCEKLMYSSKSKIDFIRSGVKERVLEIIIAYENRDALDKLTKKKLEFEASTTVRSVNRAVASLVKEGKITYTGKKFMLLNIPTL